MPQLTQVLESGGFDVSELRPLFAGGGSDVLVMPVPGGDAAIEAWRRLRSLLSRTRYWPVLLGEEGEAMEALEEEDAGNADVRATLTAAERIDGAAWFEKRRAQRLEDLEGYEPEEGEWPDDAEPNHSYSTPFDIGSGKPHPRVALALVPTDAPWEVPAHLGFGGWNECPHPEEQCAVMRYWHDRYGAEVVAIDRAVVEMHVQRPPTDRRAAMALAREQYAYCEDIVEQGTQTLSLLAAGLLNGTAWFFWWD